MQMRRVAVYLLAIMLLLLPPPGSQAGRPEPGLLKGGPVEQSISVGWVAQAVDVARFFARMTDRSLALDSAGRPHIAYGSRALYYAWHDGVAWQTTVVDGSPSVGRFASLALDSLDRPHISYWDAKNHDLKYAFYNGESWMISTADSAGETGCCTSLLVDATGRPHISYRSYDYIDGYCIDSSIKYAYYDGFEWHSETVDAESSGCYETSLALDNAGRPHISYINNNYYSGAVKYAFYNGSSWQRDSVWDGDVLDTSLALDTAGRPHIAFYVNEYFYELIYAYYDGAEWHYDPVITHPACTDPSIALDSADRPHISCVAGSALQYAHYDGRWQVETVAEGPGGYALSTSLVLDIYDRPHISYYTEWPLRSLQYAYYDGALWQIETADSAGTGFYPSLALDSLDRPHISYVDRAHNRLHYALFDGSTWQFSTVEQGRSTSWPSLELDGSDRPHIGYLDTTGGVAKYACLSGTVWITETVGPAATSGQLSLALDTGGQPHLSYCSPGIDSQTCGGLEYAYLAGASWITETVDDDGDMGRYNSLALDSVGRPHICYYRRSGEELRYAHYDGATWLTETIATRAGPCSLALDAEDRPHISYAIDHSAGGSVKYTYYDGISWHIETVNPNYIGYNSLALDDAGHPHIGFYYRFGSIYVHYDGVHWYGRTVETPAEYLYPSLALDSAGMPHLAYQDRLRGDLRYVYAVCQSLAGATISGPGVVAVGQEASYQAVPQPLDATVPITFTWSDGMIGAVVTYSWALTGTYTIGVTVTNECGQRQASKSVLVSDHVHGFYLPFVVK